MISLMRGSSGLFNRHLPGWLYEPMPYAMAATGLSLALSGSNVLLIACGLLLASAGFALVAARVSYRRAGRKARSPRSAVARPQSARAARAGRDHRNAAPAHARLARAVPEASASRGWPPQEDQPTQGQPAQDQAPVPFDGRLFDKPPRPQAEPAHPLPTQWRLLVQALEEAFYAAEHGGRWLQQIESVRTRALELASARPDASLFWLIRDATDDCRHYSSRHALLTMLICHEAARALRWDPPQTTAACLAALTMNVAIARTRDQLAETSDPRAAKELLVAMQPDVAAHAARAETLLRADGVIDGLWLEAVRRHHAEHDLSMPLAQLTPPAQITRLLQRVDTLTERVCRRAASEPVTPLRAMLDAARGHRSQPDEIWRAIAMAIGLYPPGSFVKLATGELGVVTSKGSRRLHCPLVVAVASPAGSPLSAPQWRDTNEPRFKVVEAMPPQRMPVPMPDTLVAALG